MLNCRTFLALACGVVLLELALFGSSLSFAPISEQQQSTQGAYEGYSIAQSFTYRGFAWLIDWVDRRHDFVAAAATVIIAIFTITLWRATDRLWEAGERHSERELRAYVVVYGTDFSPVPGKLISSLKIENTGQTPAHNLKIITRCCVMQHPPSAGLDFSIPDPGEASIGMLGASKHVTSAGLLEGSDLMPGEFDDATADNGWLRIYTYGTVTYDDVFKRPQWTNFCFYLQWEGTKVAATTSQYHNDAS
jgi:hypothetical protein